MSTHKVSPVKILEKEVMAAVRAYLEARRYLFIRNNTGAMKIENRFLRFGKVGSPDFLVFHSAKFYGIECKGSNGKTDPDQNEFAARFAACGGIYIVARSIDDLQKAGL